MKIEAADRLAPMPSFVYQRFANRQTDPTSFLKLFIIEANQLRDDWR
jgi:hypothetical protein